MGLIFNKITLLVIIGIIITFSLSMNEIAKFTEKYQIRSSSSYAAWLNSQKKFFSSADDCQNTTYRICEYNPCKYRASEGALETVCDIRTNKGWTPTEISLPSLYQHISALQLTITRGTSTQELILDPRETKLTYSFTAPGTAGRTVESKKIAADEIIDALNSVLLYDLSAGIDIYPQKAGEQSYSIALTGLNEGSQTEKKTIACSTTTCPRTFNNALRSLLLLWSSELPSKILTSDPRDLS